jgi:large subunit ribosomal protein L35
MPKLKTVKGVKGRFKITGTGKLLARRAGKRHLLGSRRRKTKRQLRRPKLLAAVDTKKLRSLIPYE